MNENSEHKVVKTWSRASMIIPDMLGHTIAVHNGKNPRSSIRNRANDWTQIG